MLPPASGTPLLNEQLDALALRVVQEGVKIAPLAFSVIETTIFLEDWVNPSN